MAQSDDIRQIIRQEEALVFDRFDEHAAFELGAAVRAMAMAEKLVLSVEVSLWDRRLFFAAMPGTSADNLEWLRRKFNVVRRFHAASYRLVLEQNREDRLFAPQKALDVADYALAGGGFPIRVAGVGPVGALVVSGLPQREDHNVAVRALCAALGQDAAALALPAA